jgi:hypothetical protein
MEANTRNHLVTFFLLVVFIISIVNAYYFIRLYSNRDENDVTGLSGLTSGGALILGILDIVIALTVMIMLVYRYMNKTEEKTWMSKKFLVFLFLLVLLGVSGMTCAYYFTAYFDRSTDANGLSVTPFPGLSGVASLVLGIIALLIAVVVMISILYNFFRKH